MMIAFRRRRWWESFLRLLFPAYRKYQDAQLTAALEYLLAHPEVPCQLENIYIPDGYGTHPDRQTQYDVS
jgi:hypothetical protein